MRCHHVKRHTDRMTMDGCTLTEMSFSACPPQFSERYRQARCPLRISTASVWDTDEGSSLDGELCKRWAKGIPLHVLPPAAVVRNLKDIHARTRPDNVAVPDSSHGTLRVDHYLSHSVYIHGWIVDQLTSSRSGTSRIAEKVHEVSSGP